MAALGQRPHGGLHLLVGEFLVLAAFGFAPQFLELLGVVLLVLLAFVLGLLELLLGVLQALFVKLFFLFLPLLVFRLYPLLVGLCEAFGAERLPLLVLGFGGLGFVAALLLGELVVRLADLDVVLLLLLEPGLHARRGDARLPPLCLGELGEDPLVGDVVRLLYEIAHLVRRRPRGAHHLGEHPRIGLQRPGCVPRPEAA